jgi:hypothetical protein
MHFQSLATLAMPAVAMAVAIPQDTVQIVGGVAAQQGEFPFIVSMQRSGSHICGGSLLNANTVLTAAHCAEGQSAGNIKVRAGSLVSDSNSSFSIYDSGIQPVHIQINWKLTVRTEQELWRYPCSGLLHQDPPQLLEQHSRQRRCDPQAFYSHPYQLNHRLRSPARLWLRPCWQHHRHRRWMVRSTLTQIKAKLTGNQGNYLPRRIQPHCSPQG